MRLNKILLRRLRAVGAASLLLAVIGPAAASAATLPKPCRRRADPRLVRPGRHHGPGADHRPVVRHVGHDPRPRLRPRRGDGPVGGLRVRHRGIDVAADPRPLLRQHRVRERDPPSRGPHRAPAGPRRPAPHQLRAGQRPDGHAGRQRRRPVPVADDGRDRRLGLLRRLRPYGRRRSAPGTPRRSTPPAGLWWRPASRRRRSPGRPAWPAAASSTPGCRGRRRAPTPAASSGSASPTTASSTTGVAFGPSTARRARTGP